MQKADTHVTMPHEIAVLDVSLRDVDVSGALLWDQPRYKPSGEGRCRGVRVDADHPALAFYTVEFVCRPFRSRLGAPPDAQGWRIFGSILLQLSHDSRNGLTLGCEAAVLFELLGQRPVEGESPWASIEWHSNTCVCAARGAWRGVVAEYRLWCAMYWFLKPSDVPAPDLEATVPIVKGWYPTAVLRDLVECVTPAKVHALLAAIAANAYLGSPDLVLWHADGHIQFVEVKSSSDQLREAQRGMLAALAKLAPVTICCTSELTDGMKKRCRVECTSDSE